mmetsp:Transcript_5333/g.7711  ORF Transcript_5333/g.7711 Transcript_5333/m.7711 type:complete len:460 (-) Transcript_5333:76-1455(-)|eukprot:CAMPEP_0201690266 /NCGR_PEP_ID=MMETSP0578-20130828/3729_1 /ASSEMBLY_ACC=CAM_ASM_000663 /TAXON_ID=267565 /ORGANISM="Skeletonema grethea, Strain CCMP 1804" /LENGTH=459 /DNA_ID=CAMNT_0048175195 /DNA_START=163 /DNA_END=1542 /DNA_ORIENTATION=+
MSAFRIYSLHLSQCRAAGELLTEARSFCTRHSKYSQQIRNNNNYIRLLSTGYTSSNKTTSEEVAAKTAGDDALTADGKTSSDFSGTTAKVIKPRPLFPWRSSPYPLPRLVKPTRSNTSPPGDDSDGNSQHMSDEEYYDSDYFTKGGPLGQGWISPMEPWFRVVLFASSINLLNESWLTIALPWKRNEWIKDMEWCFCDAFLRGVNGMIYDTYILDESNDERDRNENIQSDESFDLVLDLDHTIRKHKGITEDNNRRTLDQNEEHCMLQHNLRQLYQSARDHSLPSDVNIVLKTEPVSAQIVSMFPVFGLSRSLVQDHPNLRHSYRNLAKRIDRKNKEKQLEGKEKANLFEIAKIVAQGMDDLMETSAKLSDDGNGLITIIAQVAIHCREVFCVKDVATGEVLQGYPDENPRDVTHLVRFEIVIKDTHLSMDFEKKPELLVGRWQITDWDDLLDGNVWFT